MSLFYYDFYFKNKNNNKKKDKHLKKYDFIKDTNLQ